MDVFREVWRVLRDDGTVWLNLGDSYAGSGNGSNDYRDNGASISKNDNKYGSHKPLSNIPAKNLLGIPWRVAFALQNDGVADRKALEVIERARIELLYQYEDDENGIPDKVITVLEGLDKEYAEAKGNSWYLRSDIIWNKPNPMPESVKDRPTKAHEYIFLLAKNAKYYYDYEAILEIATGYDGRKDTKFKGSLKYNDETLALVGGERWPNKIRDYKTKDGGNGQSPQHHGKDIESYGLSGTELPARNKRSVWTVNTRPFKEAHFAVFPPDLIKPCILAGCPKDGTVLDPFNGSGTTGVVSVEYGRNYIGIELNQEYIKMSERRIGKTAQQGILL